jgi:hypothetical protein
VGRFLSRDTWAVDAWNPVEVNRYVYAMANPVTLVDPSGASVFIEWASLNLELGTTDIVILGGLALLAVVIPIVQLMHKIQYVDIETLADMLNIDETHLAIKEKTIDGKELNLKPLSDKQVRKKGLHEEKQQQSYRGDDTVYEDLDNPGDYYIGAKGADIVEEFLGIFGAETDESEEDDSEEGDD